MEDLRNLADPNESPFFPLLSKRILHRHLDEGWPGLLRRIVDASEKAEMLYDESDKDEYIIKLRKTLENSEFLPNSPLMVNISEDKKKIFACFALDARKPINEFLNVARQVHDGMGGVGYTLNHLKAPGEIKNFIQLFDKDTEEHQSGRPRPASNAVTVSINNPGFIGILQQAGKTKVTNLNVGIPDSFMEKVRRSDSEALEKFNMVAESIHRTGQPAILFTDRVPNVALEENAPIAANVCGESPLAADESGLLGSLNLVKFIRSNETDLSFDFEKFIETVRIGVRFLDGMHDIHYHSSPQLKKNTLSTRKIGVGLMGYAHLLILLGIRYGSEESIRLAEEIGKALMQGAQEESTRLAYKRGVYPAALSNNINREKKRNALLVAIAQTSTLSLLVNTSSGIEPINGYLTKQNILDDTIYILDPILAYTVQKLGLNPDDVKNLLLGGIELSNVIGEKLAYLFPRALDIKPEEHIEVQAAFQKSIDGGISKTLNCSFSTNVEEIKQWIQLGHEKGLIGFMIYRDNSLKSQPIEVIK